MKKINYIFLSLLFISGAVFSQIRSNNDISNTISGQSAFLDASATTFTNSVNNGKGIAFPRTNLNTFTFNPANGNFLGYPTGFDGFIVYNSVAARTPATGSGIGFQDLDVGFHYFSNPGSSGITSTGQWIPIGGPKVTVSLTETPTNAIIDVFTGLEPEYAIRVFGTTDGINTFLTFQTSDFDLSTVRQLRKCIIYDGSDNLVMEATSTFNTASNYIVTGNGMINKLLPANTYTAECYYIK